LFGRIAFADHPIRRDARDFLCPLGELIERGIRRLLLLSFHDVSHAEPLLIAVAWFNNAKHHNLRFGAAGAFGSPLNRPVALFGVVNHHETFTLVASLVAATLASHGRDAPVRSYALKWKQPMVARRLPRRQGRCSALLLAMHETDDILDCLHGFGGD